MSSENVLRIAVGEIDGRRSSTWRIWFGPQDIYASFRVLGGKRKVSIHYPRPKQPNTIRYIGYTKDFTAQSFGKRLSRQERTHIEWNGLEIAPDYYLEFRFRVPESELRRLTQDVITKILWLKPPPIGEASEVTILSGPSTHTGIFPQRSDGAIMELLLQHQLENGRYVWVLHHHIPAPPLEVMQSHREMVKQLSLNENWPISSKADVDNVRVNLTMQCEDGTVAEVELSGDFLFDRTN